MGHHVPKATIKPSLTGCRYCFRPVWLPGHNICEAHRSEAHSYLIFRPQGAPLAGGEVAHSQHCQGQAHSLFQRKSSENSLAKKFHMHDEAQVRPRSSGKSFGAWAREKKTEPTSQHIWAEGEDPVRWLRAGTGFLVLCSPSMGGTNVPYETQLRSRSAVQNEVGKYSDKMWEHQTSKVKTGQ